MFHNNNKSFIKNISTGSLKNGKMRNLLIILTIILSVSLLSGLALYIISIQEMEDRLLDTMQHVIYEEITLEQSEQLREDSRISDMRLFKEGSRTEIDDYVVSAIFVEQVDSTIQAPEVTDGNYPTEYNQIAVDKSYMKQIGHDAILGETLSFTFADGSTESFVISGFTDSGSASTLYPLYFSKEYAESGSQLKKYNYMAPAKIVDAQNMGQEEFLEAIRAIGADYGIMRQNVNENNQFVTSKTLNTQDILLILIIGTFILLASVLVIYSIFYISVMDKTRQYGQLRSLGSTSKQIKKIVRREGIILFLIGAPVGLFIGIIFAFLVNSPGWSWKNAFIVCVVVLLADYITIMFSVNKPAKIAALVSPIEAIKISGYQSHYTGSRKLHRKTTPYSLAVMSANRSKKKTMMTTISLGISGIIFTIGAAFLTSFTEESYSRQSVFKHSEIVVSFSSNAKENSQNGITGLQLENPINGDLISDIREIYGVNDVKIINKINVIYEYNNYQEEDICGIMTPEDVGLINSYQRETSFNYDEMVKNKEILIKGNNVNEEISGWRFQIGDTVKFQWYDGVELREDNFTIVGEINDRAYDNLVTTLQGYSFLTGGWFILPEEMATQMMPEGFNFSSEFLVSTDWDNKGIEVINAVDEIIAEQPLLKSFTLQDYIAENASSYHSLHTMIMGLSAFIIMFALINLINTLVTNVMSKTREFTVLQAVGMTNKQLTKMVQSEGLFLTFWNTLITLLLGSLLGYLVVMFLRENGASYLEWQFPILYMSLYILLIIIIPVIVSGIAVKLFKRKSTADRIKDL